MTSAAEPVRRTSEIEEYTNLYFIHPISACLVPLFAALRIPPNAVSLIGMACGISAGIAYHSYQNPICAIVGFIMMLAWHVMDGADGQLARLTRQYSELGKVLDGICDYVTFTAVYVGLASALAYQYGGFVWGIVTVAGLCHAMQAAAYEAQRQEYDVWGWGKDSKRILPPQASLQAAASMPKPMLVLYRLYINVQLLMIGRKLVFQEQLDAFLLAHPDRSGTIGLQYRAFFAPIVRRWAVMSANYRTIGIFVFSILGVPLYYFLAEIFLLSAVLLVLSVMRIRQDRRFLAQLAI